MNNESESEKDNTEVSKDNSLSFVNNDPSPALVRKKKRSEIIVATKSSLSANTVVNSNNNNTINITANDSGEWNSQQIAVVKSWIFSRINEQIDDLSLDLRDGRILLKVLESVTGRNLVPTTFKGTSRSAAFRSIYMFENVNKALNCMTEFGMIKKGGVGPNEIVAGNTKMILATMWSIIRYVEAKKPANSVPEQISSEETEEDKLKGSVSDGSIKGPIRRSSSSSSISKELTPPNNKLPASHAISSKKSSEKLPTDPSSSERDFPQTRTSKSNNNRSSGNSTSVAHKKTTPKKSSKTETKTNKVEEKIALLNSPLPASLEEPSLIDEAEKWINDFTTDNESMISDLSESEREESLRRSFIEGITSELKEEKLPFVPSETSKEPLTRKKSQKLFDHFGLDSTEALEADLPSIAFDIDTLSDEESDEGSENPPPLPSGGPPPGMVNNPGASNTNLKKLEPIDKKKEKDKDKEEGRGRSSTVKSLTSRIRSLSESRSGEKQLAKKEKIEKEKDKKLKKGSSGSGTMRGLFGKKKRGELPTQSSTLTPSTKAALEKNFAPSTLSIEEPKKEKKSKKEKSAKKTKIAQDLASEDKDPLPTTRSRATTNTSPLESFLPSPEATNFQPKDARDMIIKEIFETECIYFKHLDKLVLGYFPNLRDLCSQEELKTIFSNVLVIRNFSLKLLQEIQKRVENWSENQLIGDIFVKFHPFFKSYNQYCNNYDDAINCYIACMKRPEFSNFCKEELAKTPNSLGPDLQSLLIQPVQRIPRYMLLLTELLKKTPKDHPDHDNITKALEKIKEITEAVNVSIKQSDKAKNFDRIVESVQGIKKFLTSPARKYVDEVTCFLALESEEIFQKYWLIAFTDILFIASGSPDKRNLDYQYLLKAVWIIRSKSRPDVFYLITPELIFQVKKSDCTEKDETDFFKFIEKLQENIVGQFDTTEIDQNDNSRVFEYHFPSGMKYSGKWKLGKMWGKGIGGFNDKIYEGDWENGLMNGSGTMRYSVNTVYEGEWKKGLPNGRGRLIQSHVTYDGYWKNGIKCKKGILTWTNGDRFTGHFKNDNINGEGTLICKNGDKYLGTWKDNMRHGQGISISLFGRYDGEWVNNIREGNGSFLFLNGDKYVGEWKQNKRHGHGVFIFSGGKYLGKWNNNRMEGRGTLTVTHLKSEFDKEGEMKDPFIFQYDGDWKDSKPHGYGSLHIGDSIEYEGQWIEGKREGKGTYRDPLGVYVGFWKSDKRSGQGQWTSSDKKVAFVGKWNNDLKEDGDYSITDATGQVRIEKIKFGIVRVDPLGRPPDSPPIPILFNSYDV